MGGTPETSNPIKRQLDEVGQNVVLEPSKSLGTWDKIKHQGKRKKTKTSYNLGKKMHGSTINQDGEQK